MDKLVEVLQNLIEKYNISEEDVMMLQEALSSLESGMNEEFSYENPMTGEVVEGSKESYKE